MAWRPPSRKRLRFLARAFDLLHHDVLFVTPYERGLLRKAGVAPRAGWLGSEKLEVRILRSGSVRIGVLLFPPLAPRTRVVPPALRVAIAAEVKKLRSSTRLVVAMSPWGFESERNLLSGTEEHPDVLLGSGPGQGLDGRMAAGGKTVWMRSYGEGESIMRMEIFAWPERTANFKWTENRNVRMTLLGLTDAYQEDPRMIELMREMGTD